MTHRRALALALSLSLAAQARAVQVILDDLFDSNPGGVGDIGTNTNGVGTGFSVVTTGGAGGTVAENDTLASVTSASGTANTWGIVSNDSFDPTGTRIRWHVDETTTGSDSGTPSNRVGMVLQNSNTVLLPGAGTYIEVSFFGASPQNAALANLVRFATFDGVAPFTTEALVPHGLDFTSDFVVTAELNDTDYRVSWDDGGTGTGLIVGIWTTLDFATFASGNVYVGGFAQSRNTAAQGHNSTLVLDQIIVTVPAPAALPAGIAMLALSATRRRRR